MNESQFLDLYTNILLRKNTPIVDVDVSQGAVFVPREFIDQNGRIQLSLSPKAIRDLNVTNDTLYCRASFKNKIFSLSFPLANIREVTEESI